MIKRCIYNIKYEKYTQYYIATACIPLIYYIGIKSNLTLQI